MSHWHNSPSTSTSTANECLSVLLLLAQFLSSVFSLIVLFSWLTAMSDWLAGSASGVILTCRLYSAAAALKMTTIEHANTMLCKVKEMLYWATRGPEKVGQNLCVRRKIGEKNYLIKYFHNFFLALATELLGHNSRRFKRKAGFPWTICHCWNIKWQTFTNHSPNSLPFSPTKWTPSGVSEWVWWSAPFHPVCAVCFGMELASKLWSWGKRRGREESWRRNRKLDAEGNCRAFL